MFCPGGFQEWIFQPFHVHIETSLLERTGESVTRNTL